MQKYINSAQIVYRLCNTSVNVVYQYFRKEGGSEEGREEGRKNCQCRLFRIVRLNITTQQSTSLAHLGMVVHKHAHIVGIGDGAVGEVRPRPLPMDVDAGAAE